MRALLATLALLALAAAGCKSPPASAASPAAVSPPGKVTSVPVSAAPTTGGSPAAAIIVEVNGHPITRADLDEALRMDEKWLQLSAQGTSRGVAELKRAEEEHVLDMLIDEILLDEAARQAKITLTPDEDREVKRLFEERVKADWGSVERLQDYLKENGIAPDKLETRFRNGYIVRKLIHDEMGRASFVRPIDLRDYYESHLEDYRQPASLELDVVDVEKAGRPLEDARATAERARAMLATGTAFEVVKKAFPDEAIHVSAKGRGDLMAEQRAAIEPLRTGETSPVVDGARAFLAFRIQRETAATNKPFEQVEDEIYQILEDRARNERKDALLKRLREKAFIKRK